MEILIERECTATHRFYPVAKFALGIDALDAAKALSKIDGTVYRVIDPRHDETLITTYNAGEFVA